MKKILVALLVITGVITVVGVASVLNASATPGEDHKEWVCHPVEGQGETGTGWNLIEPDKASSHLDENGQGKHTRKDGRTDVYATAVGSCPGGETTPSPPSCPEGETDYNGAEPGCGEDTEEPETPLPPQPETPQTPETPEKPDRPEEKPDQVAVPRPDQGDGERPVARPVEVPTAVAAGK